MHGGGGKIVLYYIKKQQYKEEESMRKNKVKGMLAVSAAMALALSGMTVCAAEPGTTYTVQAGDSLSKIAKAAYGDAAKWKVIDESNKAVIKNPRVI